MPGGRHGTEIARICLRGGSCDGGVPRDHNVGSFPKTSKRFGCAGEGHDLPAGPLEGVLRLREQHSDRPDMPLGRDPYSIRPWPSGGLCEPGHTGPRVSGLHFHVLVTGSGYARQTAAGLST
jgi:hypothetical protein